jgi:hypothetical protein
MESWADQCEIIGRIEQGFDFLGYHFSPEGLSVAEKTIEKFLVRAVGLYGKSLAAPPCLDCTCGGGYGGCMAASHHVHMMLS